MLCIGGSVVIAELSATDQQIYKSSIVSIVIPTSTITLNIQIHVMSAIKYQ